MDHLGNLHQPQAHEACRRYLDGGSTWNPTIVGILVEVPEALTRSRSYLTCPECGGTRSMGSVRCKPCETKRQRSHRRPTVCRNCQAEFISRGKAKGVYCGRPCSYAYQSKQRAERLARVESQRAARPSRDGMRRPCRQCGALSVRPKFCSSVCSVAFWQPPRLITTRTCVVCSSSFERFRGKYCSKACAKQSPIRKAAKRASRLSRKARERSVAVARFDPILVLDRDRWTCQECGRHTPPHLRGTHDWSAPELDHITPLSAGGAHNPENTQCLCRRCNMEKGAKVAA